MSAPVTRLDLARWLIGHTRSLLPPLSFAVVARIANQLLGVVLLVQVAQAFGDAAAGRTGSLPWLLGSLVAVALGKALLRYLEHYAGHYVAFTSLARLRELFFARLVPQAPAATQGRAGAELTDRATRDIDRIEVFFAHTLPPAISAVVVPAVALGWLAAAVDGRLALTIAAFVAAIVVGVPLLSGPVTWQGAHRVAAGRGRLAEHLGDDLQGVREVLGFGIQRSRLAGLAAADDALTSARLHAGRVDGLRAAALVLLELGTLIAVVTVGAAAGLPTAAVAVALAVAVGLWAPARGVDDFVAGLDAAFAAAARVREVTDAPPLVRDPEHPREIPACTGMAEGRAELTEGARLTVEGPGRAAGRPSLVTAESGPAAEGSGRMAEGPGRATRRRREGSAVPDSTPDPAVEFDGVTFTYPKASTPALVEVDVRIPPGSRICVVGVSGSGKSTLAALLLRGWDVDSGAVRLHGLDVRQVALDDLRSRVALVPQRPTLLSGTIAGNLRLGAHQATDARLREAATVAGFDVDALPDGFTTGVAERGLNLSGGQLQRLAIARALLAAPDVLVLDEALSQLDAATARLVRDRLAVHRAGLTTIEITHRADLIPDSTPTIVLDAGRVIEQGTAGDLRAAGGAFRRLEAR